MATAKNKLKSEKKKSGKGNVFSRFFAGISNFMKEKRLRTVAGILFLLTSLFLFLSFTSYFINSNFITPNWGSDYSLVTQSISDFINDPNLKVNNWIGKVGAYVAHKFIYQSFGISSYLFVLISLVIGFKLTFKSTLLPLGKTLRHSIIILYWLPLTSAFVLGKFELLGGSYGLVLNKWMTSLIGGVGTGIFIVFFALVYSVITFNLSFENIGNWLKKQTTPADKEDEAGKDDTATAEPSVSEEETDDESTDDEETPMETELDLESNGSEEEEAEEETESIELDSSSTETEEPEKKSDDVDFEIEEAEEEEEGEEVSSEDKVKEFGEFDPTLELSNYKFPTIDLLEDHGSTNINVNKEELEANKDKIVKTLENYNIKIDKIKATIGPTVTLYEIVPEAGVRISKIKNLEDDIALSLSALGIRIIAPIPGRGTIGIEVPNSDPKIVSMKSVLASEKFQNSKFDLPIGLGRTISNEIFIADLAKMPHLLMAGATGQGKSVGLNAILVSLLYKKHPSQIKFVLVDPKKVELTLFNKIERHFLAKLPEKEEAIITDTSEVISTLNSLCIEMDMRYDLLKEAMCRNIREYNAKFIARKLNPEKGHRFLPYIVLVIDEFADLIMTAGKEVEQPIARLAQLARAIGIHLIIATQRPSVNIITGTIKANFPARIAFRVVSKVDSKTILDANGADQLIGKGDMLFSTGSELIRLQCAFVDTPEVEEVTDFIGSQKAYPDAHLLPEYVDESSGDSEPGAVDLNDRDELFEDAAKIIVQHQQGSASLLQRRLKLGYNRAGRIIDQLEAAGVIGPFEGSKARQVLVPDETSLEQLLEEKL